MKFGMQQNHSSFTLALGGHNTLGTYFITDKKKTFYSYLSQEYSVLFWNHSFPDYWQVATISGLFSAHQIKE